MSHYHMPEKMLVGAFYTEKRQGKATINSEHTKAWVTCLAQSSHLTHTCTRQTRPHWKCNVQVLGSNCKDSATGGGHAAIGHFQHSMHA